MDAMDEDHQEADRPTSPQQYQDTQMTTFHDWKAPLPVHQSPEDPRDQLFRQNQATLESDIANGSRLWRLPTEPLWASRPTLLKLYGIKRYPELGYHTDCHLIAKHWGSDDERHWLPEGLNAETPYSLHLIHALRTMACRTKKNRDLAHRAMMDAWQMRTGLAYDQVDASTNRVQSDTIVTDTKNDWWREQVTVERSRGIMLVDAATALEAVKELRQQAKQEAKQEKRNAQSDAVQRVNKRTKARKQQRERKQQRDRVTNEGVELVDMELEPGMDMDEIVALQKAGLPGSFDRGRSSRRRLQWVRENVYKEAADFQAKLEADFNDIPKSAYANKSNTTTAKTLDPDVFRRAEDGATSESSEDEEDSEHGGVLPSMADAEPSSAYRRAYRGNLAERALGYNMHHIMGRLEVKPSLDDDNPREKVTDSKKKKQRRKQKQMYRTSLAATQSLLQLPSEKTDLSALPSLHQIVGDGTEELGGLMDRVGGMGVEDK